MAKLMTAEEAVKAYIKDGMTIATNGFVGAVQPEGMMRVYFVKCFSQKSERKIPNLRNGIFPYISRKHFHMIVMQSVA